MTDIEIANSAELLPIEEIGKKAGLLKDETVFYGKYKAKISPQAKERLASKPNGKLILVTAMSPTPAGEGKTTVSIGLAQALEKIGKKTALALREPSLGPVFGIKGGAAGGGYSQILPMEDINLHFTGDIHAITAANNLLCAMVDNHLQQGNSLNLDPRSILIKRCLDMNDRALRKIVIGLGGKTNGVVREDGFVITVATETMAILCLASDLEDLKKRLGNILVGYSFEGNPLFAKDFEAEGAMTALLKDAFCPNLVQTIEHTPAIVHGGPFANIAHGCNSVNATRTALKLGDYVVTEAGFGSDLGAEKFLDLKCPTAGISPDCIVVVATIRALKYHGGVSKGQLNTPNTSAMLDGFENLKRHIENMKSYGVPVVVAINRFAADSSDEISELKKVCQELEVEIAEADVFAKGGEGGIELAKKVVSACDQPNEFSPLYSSSISLEEKMEKIAVNIYGASGVKYTKSAKRSLRKIKDMGYDKLPVCVAKTQYSFSDDPSKLGAPSNFFITVREVRLMAGAGFVVMLTGDVMTMPGLPKRPAACSISVENGKITGLF